MEICQINCIKCNKILENINPPNNQPSSGTEFTTSGHYGSTIFDPVGDESSGVLVINICDVCLQDAIDNNQVLKRSRVQRYETVLEIYK